MSIVAVVWGFPATPPQCRQLLCVNSSDSLIICSPWQPYFRISLARDLHRLVLAGFVIDVLAACLLQLYRAANPISGVQ